MGDPSTDQLEPQTDSSASKSRGLLGWFLWPLILLTFYLLSIGPALKLMERKVLSGRTVYYTYLPVFALARTCKPVATFLHWYTHDVWHWHNPGLN